MAGRRPNRLNDEQFVEDFLSIVRRYNNVVRACRELGVPEATVNDWKQKGRKNKTGLYVDFVNRLEQAQREHYDNLEQVVLDDARINARTALAVLERRRPEIWGRKDKVENTGEVNITVRRVEE